jgi:hypothetical protein
VKNPAPARSPSAGRSRGSLLKSDENFSTVRPGEDKFRHLTRERNSPLREARLMVAFAFKDVR